MNLKLWEISEEVKDLETQISAILEDESLSEEEKDEKSQTIFEKWLTLGENFNDKAEKVAHYIKHQEALAKARKEERDRLNELAKQSENQANALKRYLKSQLERLGTKKVEGKTAKISLRKKPARLLLTGEYDQIPPEFIQLEYKPKKTEIKQYLKNNPDIAVDWATLEETGEHSLIIK